ncbi:MAG: hypothetical protein RR992_08635, partial [Clostridiales bacterium]
MDGFFEREYATHIDAEDLEKYKSIFNRENIIKLFHEGKTSIIQESLVDFTNNNILWIKIELDMFLNPQNNNIEAYIYASDIDQKKVARALVDTVVNMDYDYLALLDAVADNYTIYAKTTGKTPLPPFYNSK